MLLSNDHIFVFGSNLAGLHGGGAAHYAYTHYGALWGKGEGLQGNSYAIPTKDKDIRTLPISGVEYYSSRFKDFAHKNPDMIFQLTAIGCGLAGFKVEEIAPFFVVAPMNILMPDITHDLTSAEFTKFVLEARNSK